MSYTIAIVIYGVVPNDELISAVDEHYRLKTIKAIQKRRKRRASDGIDIENDWDWLLLEAAGFTCAYESNPEFWFGIELHDSVNEEIGEAEAFDLSKLPQVTDEARAAYANNLARLPEDVRKHIGDPQWLMVWGHT